MAPGFPGHGSAAPGPTRWARLGTALPRALRRVFDMPDYGAYLEHCRRAGHPPRITEPEFLSEFFERRGQSSRCC